MPVFVSHFKRYRAQTRQRSGSIADIRKLPEQNLHWGDHQPRHPNLQQSLTLQIEKINSYITGVASGQSWSQVV